MLTPRAAALLGWAVHHGHGPILCSCQAAPAGPWPAPWREAQAGFRVFLRVDPGGLCGKLFLQVAVAQGL